MANHFVHVELHTGDLAKAKAFYGELFGWSLTDLPTPKGTYTLINVGDGTGGGMMKNPAPETPPHWLAYVGVDDIEAAAARAVEFGGTLAHPVTKIGFLGSMCVIKDPTGAYLGLWQERKGLRLW
jgi:predicted enzyme related to lactoylglutathione lyase